jgi:ABC-type multidrug transport system fused ATPase/permease subunit
LLVNVVAGMKITRIVVAHRPALVDRASCVVKVEGGEVTIVRGHPGRVSSLHAAPEYASLQAV